MERRARRALHQRGRVTRWLHANELDDKIEIEMGYRTKGSWHSACSTPKGLTLKPSNSESCMISSGVELSRLFISSPRAKHGQRHPRISTRNQRGIRKDVELNGRLLHLFHKRRRVMHGIAIGTSVKHDDECHRVQVNASLLHFSYILNTSSAHLSRTRPLITVVQVTVQLRQIGCNAR